MCREAGEDGPAYRDLVKSGAAVVAPDRVEEGPGPFTILKINLVVTGNDVFRYRNANFAVLAGARTVLGAAFGA